MQAYQARQPLVPSLNLNSLLFMRICTTTFGYFVLSISYSLISLAFMAPFERKFGHAGFVVYWMLVFCSYVCADPIACKLTLEQHVGARLRTRGGHYPPRAEIYPVLPGLLDRTSLSTSLDAV
jgi:hypothetical protein